MTAVSIPTSSSTFAITEPFRQPLPVLSQRQLDALDAADDYKEVAQ